MMLQEKSIAEFAVHFGGGGGQQANTLTHLQLLVGACMLVSWLSESDWSLRLSRAQRTELRSLRPAAVCSLTAVTLVVVC